MGKVGGPLPRRRTLDLGGWAFKAPNSGAGEEQELLPKDGEAEVRARGARAFANAGLIWVFRDVMFQDVGF